MGHEWQDKSIRKLEAKVYDEDFQLDLKKLPSDTGSEHYFSSLLKLLEKHDLPIEIYRVVANYIKTGKIVPEYADSDIFIISDKDETVGPTDSLDLAAFNYTARKGFTRQGVYLHIPPFSTRIELKSFIDDNWEYIEQKIGKEARTRRSTKAKRNAAIYSLSKRGLSTKEITKKINTDYKEDLIDNEVIKIIKHMK